MRKSISLFAFAFALVPLVAACSSGDDDDGLRADTQSIDSSSEADESTSASGSSGSGEVLGTAKARHPVEDNQFGDQRMVPLRVDLVRLERAGDLVHVTLTLVNEAAAPAGGEDPLSFSPGDLFGETSGTADVRDDEELEIRKDISALRLVDNTGQKAYMPVYDTERNCLCTGDIANLGLQPGDSFELVATIGGLPDDVGEVDVILPGFPPIAGVAL